MNLKTVQIGSLILELFPLIDENVFVWLCHQHNSKNIDQIFLKHADKVDMDSVLDSFETWPDRIIW